MDGALSPVQTQGGAAWGVGNLNRPPTPLPTAEFRGEPNTASGVTSVTRGKSCSVVTPLCGMCIFVCAFWPPVGWVSSVAVCTLAAVQRLGAL